MVYVNLSKDGNYLIIKDVVRLLNNPDKKWVENACILIKKDSTQYNVLKNLLK